MGSIPFGLILTKLFLMKDIREVGSGNIGATNVLRTGNKFIGYSTLALDVLKAIIPVIFVKFYYSDFLYIASLCAFLGHVFPIWLKFKGGKGVAAYLGVILALSYKFFLVFGISWLILSFLFRFASLSSIASSLIIFIYAYFFNDSNYSLILFIFLVIIIYTHRENIVRLKNSKENKIKL
jgi:glycerol-3-phosphate acyltransferase PlsY